MVHLVSFAAQQRLMIIQSAKLKKWMDVLGICIFRYFLLLHIQYSTAVVTFYQMFAALTFNSNYILLPYIERHLLSYIGYWRRGRHKPFSKKECIYIQKKNIINHCPHPQPCKARFPISQQYSENF